MQQTKTVAIIETGMTNAIMIMLERILTTEDKDDDDTHHNGGYKPFIIRYYK